MGLQSHSGTESNEAPAPRTTMSMKPDATTAPQDEPPTGSDRPGGLPDRQRGGSG
jgi:hypothetical protein